MITEACSQDAKSLLLPWVIAHDVKLPDHGLSHLLDTMQFFYSHFSLVGNGAFLSGYDF